MPGQFQYSTLFEPLLLQGQTARIYKADGLVDLRVVAVDALPSYRHDFGALTANSTGNDVTQLDMPKGEFAQYRFIIWDQFEVEFTHPGTSVRHWRSDTQNHRVRPWAMSSPPLPEMLSMYLFASSEFYVYQDETPRFDLYPMFTTILPAIQGHTEFLGYRYAFEKIGDEGITKIWANSWPSGLVRR